MVQAILGGLMLRALLDRKAPLNSLADWIRFALAAGLIAPLLGGVVALWMLHVDGHASLPFFSTG